MLMEIRAIEHGRSGGSGDGPWIVHFGIEDVEVVLLVVESCSSGAEPE